MNQIICKIDWNKKWKLKEQPDSFHCGNIMLNVHRSRVFKFDSRNYIYKNQILSVMLGYLTNFDELCAKQDLECKHDVELIRRLYSQSPKGDKLAFYEELDGIFLFFIYDKELEKGYLCQSIFGYSLPVYYSVSKDGLVFSTSLKLILKNINERKWNFDAVYDFLYCSAIIPNHTTLIQGINKLLSQTYMEINFSHREAQVKLHSIKLTTIPEDIARKELINTICKSVARLSDNLKSTTSCLTLTGGWDSNLLLWALRHRNKIIKAITINGGEETNEIPAVRRILSYYREVQHHSDVIEDSIVQELPNIVWIYEGYVYHKGILLRYVLAKLLEEIGVNSIFLGSCADAVLDSRMGPGADQIPEPYFSPLSTQVSKMLRNLFKKGIVGNIYYTFFRKQTGEKYLRRRFLRLFFKCRVNLEVDYNMKMHELILNNYDITGLYPFLNLETVRLARCLRRYNHMKELYKELLEDYLGREITANLKKSSNVIDSEKIRVTDHKLLSKIMKSKFVGYVLTKTQLSKVQSDPHTYKSIIGQLLYLMLFEELFLTGDYDYLFGDRLINVKLDTVLGSISSGSR